MLKPMSSSASAVPPGPCPSPCVRLCTLNEEDVCLGCGRTLADITGWTKMSEADKQSCVERAHDNLIRLGRPLPHLKPRPPGQV